MRKKKLYFLLFFLFAVSFYIVAIKFKIKTKEENEIILQAIFDTGFSLKGVADGFGITDYETVFFKPAFHINNFGIGLVFDFRFRFLFGETIFAARDWYDEENKINNLYAYIDKIDYIRYGALNQPFFLNVGKNPVATLGSGLLVNDFHNHAFNITSKEQGLFFKFNANNLNKIKRDPFNFDCVFLTNDLLDPDIFIADAGFDLFKLTKMRERQNFSLRLGQVYALDINAGESNRLSSISDEEEYITSHRNMASATDAFTSVPLFTSLYTDFKWEHEFFKLNGFGELGFLFDISNYNNSGFSFGVGSKSGAEIRVVKIKNSGFLLGILAGVVIESPHYIFDYFGSNYEVVRKKQYISLNAVNESDSITINSQARNEFRASILAGFGLYGFEDKLKFNFSMAIPVESPFKMKLSAKIILENTLVQGLYMSIYYQTSVNTLSIAGTGSGFGNFLTEGFRFSADMGYKFFAAKLNVSFGIQRAGWVESGLSDSEQYWKDLQKFVLLEISFVL